MKKQNFFVIFSLCFCFLISTVSTIEKADHLKGKSNFNPGICATPTCLTSGSLIGWQAFIRLTDPATTVQYRIETNQYLLGTTTSDYWARLTLISTNQRICLYHYVSIPQTASFQIQLDYYIPQDDWESGQSISVFFTRANTNTSAASQRVGLTQLRSFNNLPANAKNTLKTDPASFPKADFAFIYICDNSAVNFKSSRVTNIHLLQTCDADEFVITLVDGSERCGDTATLSQYANCDFFKFVSGSTTNFEFDSCNSTGFTPTVVNLTNTKKGCAQKNFFNATTYKPTTVPIGGSNKFYLIPESCNLKSGQVLCTQSFYPYCRSYSFQGLCLTCEQGYLISSDGKKCIERIDYCSVYSFFGECTTCITGYTLSSGVCLKCEPGFSAFQGDCVQNDVTPISCTKSQYRNSQGVCVEGNVENCDSYLSPSGDCKTCKPGYDLTIFKKCISPCLAPTKDSQKYLIVNGKCVLVNVLCMLANEDGYCAVCQEGYYASKGTCYRIPQATQSLVNLSAETFNPYLKDSQGNQYLPMPSTRLETRIYVSGPWKDKEVYIDENGNMFERNYLTGPGQKESVYTDSNGYKYIIINNNKIYITGPDAAVRN